MLFFLSSFSTFSFLLDRYTDYHFRINVCRPLIKACGTASTSMVCEYRTTSYAMNLGAVTTTPTLSNGAVQLIAVAGSKMSQFDFQCDETIPVGTPVYVDEVTCVSFSSRPIGSLCGR